MIHGFSATSLRTPALGTLVALACLLPTPLRAQADPWPESCRLTHETIFDRPVRIHSERLAVPDVGRHEPALGLDGRYVEIDGGVRLWVEEVGEGPPLLLVAGGPGTSHHYFHPHLIPAAAFARLVYVDLRGVGRSDRTRPEGGYTVASAVRDLESLRKALGLERWSILGNSFGGAIAQLYALEHPDRLDRMILTSTVVPMDVDVGLGVRQRDFMSAEEIARVDDFYVVDGERVPPVHSDHLSAEEQPEVLFNAFMNGDWKRRHLCRMSEDEIARFARYEFVHDRNYYPEMVESLGRMELSGRFDESRIPTLIVEGRWDLAFAPWKPERMRQLYPGAEVVILEEAGHTLFEDDPGGFFTAIERFMVDQANPSSSTDMRSLSWSAARAAVAGGQEEARANGWAMVFAVLDEGGYPILLERMDGAQPASVEIALAKARAALEFRRPTAEMQRWVQDGGTHLLGLPGIVPVGGGVPVQIGDRVIGALGVSGASAAEDGVAAAAALRALSAVLDVEIGGAAGPLGAEGGR